VVDGHGRQCALPFPNNDAITQAVINGEIPLGLVNHYYVFEFKVQQPDAPIDVYFFPGGDPGSLINVAGAGVVNTSDQPGLAQRLLLYLLGRSAQEYFADVTGEYPLVEGMEANPEVKPMSEIQPPGIDLSSLADLQGTLDLYGKPGLCRKIIVTRKVGLDSPYGRTIRMNLTHTTSYHGLRTAVYAADRSPSDTSRAAPSALHRLARHRRGDAAAARLSGDARWARARPEWLSAERARWPSCGTARNGGRGRAFSGVDRRAVAWLTAQRSPVPSPVAGGRAAGDGHPIVHRCGDLHRRVWPARTLAADA
jgi:hypothetical protein